MTGFLGKPRNSNDFGTRYEKKKLSIELNSPLFEFKKAITNNELAV